MKLQHCSIPADNPEKVATTLGRIVGGEVTRFPPGGPDAWMVWSKEDTMQIECTPRGHLMFPEKEEVYGITVETPTRYSEVHIGICVDLPDAEITKIAQEAGWPVRPSVRAPGPDGFHVLEVWVEGKFLLEFVDPVQAPGLNKSVTVESWKRIFGL